MDMMTRPQRGHGPADAIALALSLQALAQALDRLPDQGRCVAQRIAMRLAVADAAAFGWMELPAPDPLPPPLCPWPLAHLPPAARGPPTRAVIALNPQL